MGLFSKRKRKGRLKGAIKGGIKGFVVGGWAGAAVGAAGGARAGRGEYEASQAQKKQDIANVGMARDTVGAQFESSAQNREGIEKSFTSDVSSARARFAASGADLESASWERVYGNLVMERDTALKEADAADDTFRGSESYKLFREDYEQAVGNLTGGSRSGTQIYSKEQQGQLRSGDSGSSIYKEYTGMLTPSMEEYQRGQFGTDDEKAAYQTMMSDRITSANKWYDTQLAANEFASKNKNKFSFGGS